MKRQNSDLRLHPSAGVLYPGYPLLAAAEPVTLPPGGWWFLLSGISASLAAFIALILVTIPPITREDFVILRGRFVAATEDAKGSLFLKLDSSDRWFQLAPHDRLYFKHQEFQEEIPPGTPLSVAIVRPALHDRENRPFVLFEVASDTKSYLAAQPLLATRMHERTVTLPVAVGIILLISCLFFGVGILELQQGRIRARAGNAYSTDV